MRIAFFLSVLFIALASPASTAATKKTSKKSRAKNIQQERNEIELLQRSTELYWDGVRWNNPEKSSAFVEDPTNRMQFQQWLEERFANHRVMKARVLSVQIGPPLEKESKDIRTAKISVSVEGYTLPEQVVKNETVVQLWYRSNTGWWLKWSASPEATDSAKTTDSPQP